MGLDFDVLEYCRELRTTKQPPYNCPVNDCGKTYKSMCGLQYHLVNYDHSDKISASGSSTQTKDKPSQVTAKKRSSKSPVTKKSKYQDDYTTKDENKLEIEIDDKTYYIGIDEPISLISKQNYELLHPSSSMGFSSSDSSSKKEAMTSKFPEPSFSIINDYSISKAPPKPLGYIRYIERSNDELDGEIEYDIDEEDSAWLDIINKNRKNQNLDAISVDVFELLMDRLEKESFFQMSSNKEVPALIDDDAICCICMDGECQNSNVILFCDMCNLAVHQDCYGVPYIPEGQWLCRRCLQSPSRAVDCVLCPNNGGAFKQTDRGHWAHVVCALWIPEVRFANTIFLEPIDSIEAIPAARWKLTCYLCKQRGVGACIQCYKSSCYAAFHVTCAQMTGLYMKMDAIEDNNSDKGEDAPVIVQKIAYCTTHTPPDAEVRPKINFPSQPTASSSSSAPPVISIPTIPPDRIQEIKSLFSVSKKNQFMQRLIAYWTLKRQLRNGVPLLRRLQPTHLSKRGDASDDKREPNDINELKRQLKYWQSLRQDLERARLLCELVRKREKLKKELVKMKEQCLELQLCPLVGFLRRLVDLLRSRDTGEIFIEPVDLVEVPDYSDIVKYPMDLSTMRHKVDSFQYNNLKEFEDDFNLMINNCLAYNSKDTVFYRAALKMREQGGAILKQAQKDLEILGLVNGSEESPSDQGNVSPVPKNETTPADIDLQIEHLADANTNLMPEERIDRLQQLLDDCSKLKSALSRCRKIKHINKLISSIKRKKTNEFYNKLRDNKRTKKCLKTAFEASTDSPAINAINSANTSTDLPVSESEPTTPVKGISKTNCIVSPSGVNRRTAVLFTRKAAAALKSTPSSPQSPAEDLTYSQVTTHRRRGRQKYSLPFNFTNNSANSDSFNTYRTDGVKSDDSNSDRETSCSGCSSSGIQCGSSSRSSSDWSDSESDMNKDNSPMEALDQLQLVWAKCRGYPWYPALIINPKMPPGYMHNGVPIPIPPDDVIALANNYTEPVYLVLFFDTKRTWQWLPRNKLEPLGITYELDYLKLTESRKPTDRKAVKKAYHEAMKYRTQIDKNPESVSTSVNHDA